MQRFPALLILLLSTCGALNAATPIFRARLDYSVSEAPSIAFADFNLDGKLDMAVARGGGLGVGGEICIMLGNGDGSFTQSYCVQGTGILPIASRDFDGDGKPDVLALSNKLEFFHGNGDGTLAPPVVTTVAGGSLMAVGDLNGDGKADVAITGDAGVSVAFGDGAGNFGAPAWYLSGFTYGVSIGDLNGDGKPDLVVSTGNGLVVTLLNTGNGLFTPGPSVPTAGATLLVLADFNGDGKLDLAMAVPSLPSLLVALGKGDGSFSTPVPYTAQTSGAGVYAVAAGDLNGDGKLDLVAAGSGTSNASVLFGRGDGTFAPAVYYSATERATFVAIAALRKPGLLDVVVSSNLSGSLSILLNTGRGALFENSVTASPVQLNQFVSGDFNHDGRDDLAIVTNTNLVVLLGTGLRSIPFVPGASATFSSATPIWVVKGDFNGDGRLDLAASLSSNSVAVLLGNGNGTFSAPIYSPAGFPTAMGVGDLNKDGKLDLVSAYGYTLFGKGDGTFYPPFTWGHIQAFSQQTMVVADVNGDGNLDVIGFPFFLAPGIISPYSLAVLLGNGKGSFSGLKVTPIPSSTSQQLALTDVNGDRKLDAIVAVDQSVIALLGNGDGTFSQSWQSPQMFAQFGGVVSGDFDGDGKVDIAVADQGNNTIWVFTGNGDGTFQAPQFGYGVNLGTYHLVSGHFQGQGPLGKPDLATTTIKGVDMLFQWKP